MLPTHPMKKRVLRHTLASYLGKENVVSLMGDMYNGDIYNSFIDTADHLAPIKLDGDMSSLR